MIFEGKRMSVNKFYDYMDDNLMPVKKDLFLREIFRFEDDINAFPQKKESVHNASFAVVDFCNGIPVIRTFLYSYIQSRGDGNFYECKRDFLGVAPSITRGRYYKGLSYEYGFRFNGDEYDWTNRRTNQYGYFIEDYFDYDKIAFRYDFYGKEEIEKSNLIEREKLKCFYMLIKEPKYEIAYKLGYFYEISKISSLSPKQIAFLIKNKIIYRATNILALQVYDIDAIKSFNQISSDDLDRFIRITGYTKFDLIRFAKNYHNLLVRKAGARDDIFDDNYCLDMATYLDYLDNLITLQIPLNHDLIFNRNYDEEHRILVEQIQIKKDKVLDAKYKKAAKKLKWMEYNGEYLVKVPSTIGQFKIEGTRLHHCVYKNEYYQKVLDGTSIILFIRRKEKPTSPFVTVELSPKDYKVRQNYAIRDSTPPEDVINFVNQISKMYKEKSQCLQNIKSFA